MSYDMKGTDVHVVICDICSDFSWIGDHDWHVMPHRSGEEVIHLCRPCRRVAVWCPAHQQYHLPDAFHRQPCIDCGGLFTSIVQDVITRCPSCRRAATDYPAQTIPPAQERPRSLLRLLFSPRAGHRH